MFARCSFWCSAEAVRSAGLDAQPYHAYVPSFGELRFVLAAGGCRPSAAAPIEGAIVGVGHRLGHRLRDGGAWPPPARTERVAVVIVGGGVAGLGAAWHLARSGVKDLAVLELEDTPGGNAR